MDQSSRRPTGFAGQRRPARILVAEDNAVNKRLAVRFLEKLGCVADTASNGTEALFAVKHSSYDLVLMDCQMPDVDGYQATRLIRQWESGSRRTPIVAMTANAMQGDRERCIEAGMDDYLPKPLDLRSLARALERWTSADAHGAPDAPAESPSLQPAD